MTFAAHRRSSAGRPAGLPWTEMGFEALLLGLFMVSACACAVLIDHPGSPVRRAMPDPLARRALTGALMGLTAIVLIYSPAGRRSGAHMNPAVTLAFTSLGRLPRRFAAGYMAAQFAGGIAGVALMAALIGSPLADPTVLYAVTRPGPRGVAAAFAAEAAISFALLFVVLLVSRSVRFMRFAGLAAGFLVAAWITLEAPLSGMSMNPARTLGSSVAARDWTAIWLYFVAPPLGMLAAAGLQHLLFAGRPSPTAAGGCAKFDHDPAARCIFCEARSAAAIRSCPAGAGRSRREPKPARVH